MNLNSKIYFFEINNYKIVCKLKNILGGGQHCMNILHDACHLECRPHMNLYKSINYKLGYFI